MNTTNVSRTGHRRSRWASAVGKNDGLIVLQRGELWDGSGVGMTIRAREGAVWVTQEGDGRDVILSAGESFRATRPGRVIAEALQGTAELCVCGAR